MDPLKVKLFLLNKRAFVKLSESEFKLFFRIHDDRAAQATGSLSCLPVANM